MDCSICLNVIDISQNIHKKLSCKHLFHKDCINRWIGQNIVHGHYRCPNCQYPHPIFIPQIMSFPPLFIHRIIFVA